MDFTKFSKLSSRARNFHDFLGDILDGEREILNEPSHTPTRAPFAVRSDIDNALMLPSRGRGLLTIEDRFAALAPFFEAGFIFEQTELDESRMRSMFFHGQVFVPKGRSESRVPANLPAPGFAGVLRGRIDVLLATYELQGVESLKDAFVFAISPRRGVVALLVCNRPHPWQVGVIESAHNLLSAGRPTT